MKKLNENEMADLNGGSHACLTAIVYGSSLGILFGGVGTFVGALMGALSPACTG